MGSCIPAAHMPGRSAATTCSQQGQQSGLSAAVLGGWHVAQTCQACTDHIAKLQHSWQKTYVILQVLLSCKLSGCSAEPVIRLPSRLLPRPQMYHLTSAGCPSLVRVLPEVWQGDDVCGQGAVPPQGARLGQLHVVVPVNLHTATGALAGSSRQDQCYSIVCRTLKHTLHCTRTEAHCGSLSVQ